jgi:hypothetical protein
LYGSQFAKLLFIRRVTVPPYCGVPSESHQFPVEAVVVTVVVIGVVVVEVVVVVVVLVVVVTIVDVGVDVFVDVEQDAISMEATIKRLKHNHIILFFIC